ncbi:MAG: TRAP transporter substrate-binding protein [Phyllobacterium sp.]
MRSIRGLVLIAILFGASTTAGAQDPIVIRFSQLVPPTHPYHTNILVPWSAAVAKATSGRVKIEITTAPLGAMPRNFDLVVTGVADAAGGNHALTPGRFQITQIVQTVVGTDSPEAVSVAFWRTHKRFLEQANEHAGAHVLALHVSGSLHLFTTNKEVRALEDIKGLKLLAPGPVASKLVENLGGVPIARPVTEYYDLVSKGVVDGAFSSNSAIGGFKVDPFMKHRIEIPGGYHFSSFFVVVNQKKWDSIGKAERDAIERVSGEEYAKLAGKALGEQQDSLLADFKKKGTMQMNTASAETMAGLKKTLEFFDRDWVAAAKTKGVDGEAALRFFREQAAAYK